MSPAPRGTDGCASEIIYRLGDPVSGAALNALFAASWPEHRSRDFSPVLARSLVYVCAYCGARLIGFVNLAWDGGIHAFVLDTTVHPALRRRGIGTQLVQRAAAVARTRGVRWLHVDCEPSLRTFYRRCGFRPTEAGLLWLGEG